MEGHAVTAIGDAAFQSCTRLMNVILPNGVTTIGENALASCTKPASITIPGSVSEIGDFAFFDSPCKITVPRGSYAEQYCKENELTYGN